jgi:hypothetical protein
MLLGEAGCREAMLAAGTPEPRRFPIRSGGFCG